MKKIITKNIIAICVMLATGIFIGCAGFNQVKSYQTIGTVEATANASYKAYQDLVVIGQVKTNDMPIVAHSYNAFQATVLAAIAMAKNNTNAPATESVQNAAISLTTAIANASTK